MKIVLDVSEFQSPGQLDKLLSNAPDEIVGVYIKGAQGTGYSDELAEVFARVCNKHKTPFGWYDYLTNQQTQEQSNFFKSCTMKWPIEALVPMLDCEGSYDLYDVGVQHFEEALGEDFLIYSSLNDSYHYTKEKRRWVAAYPSGATRTDLVSPSEIETYKEQGFLLWQFTDNYLGMNQDASILLGSYEGLRIAPNSA